MTLAEAATIAGVGARTLQQAAKSGTLQTTVAANGYTTTEAWLEAWQQSKRRGRPSKKEKAS